MDALNFVQVIEILNSVDKNLFKKNKNKKQPSNKQTNNNNNKQTNKPKEQLNILRQHSVQFHLFDLHYGIRWLLCRGVL